MSLRLPQNSYKALCRDVLDRDGWRCRNPRCNMRNGLHVHHVQFRSEGGVDESWNLLTLCALCHEAIHRYELFISVPEDSWIGIDGGCDGKVIFTLE